VDRRVNRLVSGPRVDPRVDPLMDHEWTHEWTFIVTTSTPDVFTEQFPTSGPTIGLSLCVRGPKTHDAMRQHFATGYDQGLSFNEDRSYDKCDLCMKHVRPARWLNTRSRSCFAKQECGRDKGVDRCGPAPSPRSTSAKMQWNGVEVSVSGRIASQDDHDLSACVQSNAQRKMGCRLRGP
jgi:hypothetical protein